MELPFLKSLDLSYLGHLVSLMGSENLSGTGDGMQEHQVFFNPRVVFSALEQFSLVGCNRILKLWDKELGISSFRSLRTIKIDGCGELLSIGSLLIFSTLVQLESLTIERCNSMHEVISSEGTKELEERDQVVIFPQLKDLVVGSSYNLKSFYGGKCKLKFPNLKNMQLRNLDCLNKFAGSENQSVLFHKEMIFPCLEVLSVTSVNNEVMGLWEWHLERGSTPLLNSVPMLRSSDFKDAAAALSFFEQLKNLELNDLPILKMIPMHLFKSICSLKLQGLSWDYVFSADAFVMLQDSLQHLETLDIRHCKNMSVSIQDGGKRDAGLVFKFPRLRNIVIYNSSIIGFSTTVTDTLYFPSLERIDIYRCDVIQQFWSGPIIAPKLKEVSVEKCKTIKRVLVGDPNHMVELPSLTKVSLMDCPAMLCFSSGPLITPNRRKVRRSSQMQSFSAGSLHTPNTNFVTPEGKVYSMADFEMNLNHFLRSCHDVDFSAETI